MNTETNRNPQFNNETGYDFTRASETISHDQLKTSAELLISAGELALAKNVLVTLIRNGANSGWALRELGKIYQGEGQTEKSRRAYQDAIAYEPHLEAYRSLALIEIESKNDLAAADLLERALHLQNLSPEIRFELHKASGNCWMRAQRTEKSEQHYRKALLINPTSDQVSCNLGALYLQSGKIQEAQKFFEDALVTNPTNYRALSGLATSYLALGKKEEAHQFFGKSLEIELNQPNAIFHLVRCAYEIKSYASASKLLAEYVKTIPPNANLLYSLAGLQFHLGKVQEANETVAEIQKIQPTHTGANELQKLIERYILTNSHKIES